LANWEKKSAYLLRETVKFTTYIDALELAGVEKEKMEQEKREREREKAEREEKKRKEEEERVEKEKEKDKDVAMVDGEASILHPIST